MMWKEVSFDLGTLSDDIKEPTLGSVPLSINPGDFRKGTFRPNAAYNAPKAAASLDDGTSFARIALRLKGASTPQPGAMLS